MDKKKRLENERKFKNWDTSGDGSRIYYYDVEGRSNWKARYVKEVDKNETTISFYQEIYNEQNVLVEIHEKYPKDKGHRRL